MGALCAGSHAYGVRHNSVTLLHNTDTNKLEAVIEPGAIATIRTGAATGVAVKYMSRPDATIAGIIGTGRLSGIQIDAIRAVRDLSKSRSTAATRRSATSSPRPPASASASRSSRRTPPKTPSRARTSSSP